MHATWQLDTQRCCLLQIVQHGIALYVSGACTLQEAVLLPPAIKRRSSVLPQAVQRAAGTHAEVMAFHCLARWTWAEMCTDSAAPDLNSLHIQMVRSKPQQAAAQKWLQTLAERMSPDGKRTRSQQAQQAAESAAAVAQLATAQAEAAAQRLQQEEHARQEQQRQEQQQEQVRQRKAKLKRDKEQRRKQARRVASSAAESCRGTGTGRGRGSGPSAAAAARAGGRQHARAAAAQRLSPWHCCSDDRGAAAACSRHRAAQP